jgi:hypothetical protein
MGLHKLNSVFALLVFDIPLGHIPLQRFLDRPLEMFQPGFDFSLGVDADLA